MKKIYVIGIALLIILLSVSSVSAGLFDFLGGSDEKIIKIESDNPSLSGKLQITEYKDINKKSSYTYGDFAGGATNDILIKDGQAEYKLHDDTEFFKVDSYVDNIKYDNSTKDTPKMTVKYLKNNDTLLSSTDEVLDDFCDVSFGNKVCTLDGQTLSLS